MITQNPKELSEWVEVLRKVVREGTKQQKAKVNSFWEKYFGKRVRHGCITAARCWFGGRC